MEKKKEIKLLSKRTSYRNFGNRFDLTEKNRIFADRKGVQRQSTEYLFNEDAASRAVEYSVDKNY